MMQHEKLNFACGIIMAWLPLPNLICAMPQFIHRVNCAVKHIAQVVFHITEQFCEAKLDFTKYVLQAFSVIGTI